MIISVYYDTKYNIGDILQYLNGYKRYVIEDILYSKTTGTVLYRIKSLLDGRETYEPSCLIEDKYKFELVGKK